MIVYADHELEVYQVLGPIIRVHWDYEQYEVEIDSETNETKMAWKCKEAVVPLNATRDEFEKIINDAGGNGKQLADGWFQG